MSLNQLQKFREAYIRSIAQAWHDHAFASLLVTCPVDALKEFGFCWPWQHICDLRVIDATDSTAWIQDCWVTKPGQVEMLQLQVPLSPRLAEAGPPGTGLLPLEPSPDLLAMALADYYRQRAVLFSDDPPPGEPAEAVAHTRRATSHAPPRAGDASERFASFEPLRAPFGLNSPFPVGGFAPAQNTFESFKVAILAAIAEAWRSSDYRQMLELDARSALRRIRDYDVPWGLRLTVVHDRNTHWSPPAQTPDGVQSGWHNCTNNRLTLILPRAPRVDSRPVALAAYNAAGAAYPFTCCL
jgi:ribosomally synthesized peptide (two-chain TOMM family)